VCGHPVTIAFTTTDRNRRLSRARFTYYRCTSCATLTLVPVPSDLEHYYPDEYYDLPRSREELLADAAPERYKLEIIDRFVATGRLVEIGPAVGRFAVVAQDAGYETSAIEMNPACCRFLRNALGIRVHETDNPSHALAADGPFDVVAMWHVLEHLSDPRAVLAAAAAALRPGGVIVLAAPNPGAFQFQVFGSRWTHVDAPRHLVLIPIAALERLARELGLESVLVTTHDAGTIGWNRFGWRESLAGFGHGSYAKRGLRLLGSLAARAMAPFDRRDHRGSTYTLVFRRPAAEGA
jgi:2-polyprenyl-3-methyl-5-hydroxy-6-metoxy-1,4-benzoquinol methylase